MPSSSVSRSARKRFRGSSFAQTGVVAGHRGFAWVLFLLERSERNVIPFSVLDLAPIAEGSDAAQALHNTLDLAQHAERWGYNRF